MTMFKWPVETSCWSLTKTEHKIFNAIGSEGNMEDIFHCPKGVKVYNKQVYMLKWGPSFSWASSWLEQGGAAEQTTDGAEAQSVACMQ